MPRGFTYLTSKAQELTRVAGLIRPRPAPIQRNPKNRRASFWWLLVICGSIAVLGMHLSQGNPQSSPLVRANVTPFEAIDYATAIAAAFAVAAPLILLQLLIRQSRRPQVVRAWCWDDEGISLDYEAAESRTYWAWISAVHETREGVLLRMVPEQFVLIPPQAFENDAERTAFITTCRQRCVTAANEVDDGNSDRGFAVRV